MSNEPAVDGNERKLDCGHAESSRRIDWEVFPFPGMGEYGTLPYRCAECGLSVRDPGPPPTFGGNLAAALAGVCFIVLLSVLGVVPYLLFGLWVLLAIGALYVSGKVLAAVVSLIARLAVKSSDNIRALLQT